MTVETPRPPCPLSPEQIAWDIHRVVRYACNDPENYCIHMRGANQDVALRALQPDSNKYLADVIKVTRWVLSAIQFKANDGALTDEDKRIRQAAFRLDIVLFEPIEHRERKDAAK